MALIPLTPRPPKAVLCNGWELVATEAGRSAGGLKASITALNGEPQATQTLTMGNVKHQQAFADRVMALSGIAREVILQALPKLTYAIEGLLRNLAEAQETAHATKNTAKRSGNETSPSGQALCFDDVDPWPESVAGAALLDELAQIYPRYLVLPAGGSTTLALWTIHTYLFDAFDVSPYLTITSPQKRCGKSTVLRVVRALAHALLLLSNATPAALFRTIELVHPTLLVDEAETFVRDNEELRGILNSGHTKGTAFVLRTVGEEHEPRMFSTWTPKALASIGRLPNTLRDHSIVLTMHRKTKTERVARWREREASQYLDVRRRCVRWAADAVEALRTADPAVPEALNDREADNWATLLAIADQAGDAWRQRTEAAITALTGTEEEDDDDVRILLLADLRRVFTEKAIDKIASESLMEWLKTQEERPWADYGQSRGREPKPITPRQVARLLKPFGIRSKKIRMNAASTVNGYLYDDCIESFLRYLSSDTSQRSGTAEQTSNDATKDAFRSGTAGGMFRIEKPVSPRQIRFVPLFRIKTPLQRGRRRNFRSTRTLKNPSTRMIPFHFKEACHA
jgi:hypothetical protein